MDNKSLRPPSVAEKGTLEAPRRWLSEESAQESARESEWSWEAFAARTAVPESDKHVLHSPVLVLNASYEPINITPVRRAVVLVFKGVATTEEEDGSYLHSSRLTLRVPSVIRLREFRRIPHQSRALSRKNILLRDRYTCQFCGRTLPANDLTLDHVIPRSRGGRTDWDNLVACCHACNNRKGDRLAEETGLKLLRPPRPFTLHTSRQLMRMAGNSDERWRKYLFY